MALMLQALEKAVKSGERVDDLVKRIQEKCDPIYIEPEFQKLFMAQEEFMLWKKHKKGGMADCEGSEELGKNSESLKAKMVKPWSECLQRALEVDLEKTRWEV